MIISLSHLTIGYSASHPVITDIDLALRSGQLSCLIGENGIGKSTLLKTLTGFLPKLGGNLLLDGRDIQSYSQRELAREVSIVLTQKPECSKPHDRGDNRLGKVALHWLLWSVAF